MHAPLDANTQNLMNAEAFAKMKKSAIFLNLGRDVYKRKELMPDYFIGVSAGIAFGVSYLSKQKGRILV